MNVNGFESNRNKSVTERKRLAVSEERNHLCVPTLLKRPTWSDQLPAAKAQTELVKLDHFFAN